MRKFRLLALIFLPLLLIWVLPAYAHTITPPDSVTISNVKVFRSLAQTDDMLVEFHYSMPYAGDNYTDTPASKSIMFRLYDVDGTTLSQSSTPYVYTFFESNGYGEGVGSFYLTPDEAPDWEASIKINICGVPAFFSLEDPFPKDYTLTLSNYVAETTSEANRQLLKDWVLLECDDLTVAYEDTGVVLKTSSDAGIILSQYGEGYFRGAITGLQALCPELFFIQTLIPQQMEVQTYDMSLGETYTERLGADEWGEGFTNLGSLIGVGGLFAAAAVTFILSFIFCLWTTKKGWGTEIGMMGSALIIIGMAILVGDIVFTIMMCLSLVASMGLVWLVFLKKA